MIYLLWGAPSQGKTYYATYVAIQELLKGKRVFSNYPIVFTEPPSIQKKVINLFLKQIWRIKKVSWVTHKLLYMKLSKKPTLTKYHKFVMSNPVYTPKYLEKEYSTLKWEDDYVYQSLQSCVIILDEAYRSFSSRKRDVKEAEHLFFSTNGHTNIEIYLIAQHYNRLDLIIREMANYYVFISKMCNPFSFGNKGGREGELKPLFFTIETYTSEDEYKYRRIFKTVYSVKRILFSKKVADAFNTQYFKGLEKPIRPQRWSELMKNQTIGDVDFMKGLKPANDEDEE